jgi:hypothetical protein
MALRRLIDLPGVAGLETQALMKRDFAEPQARAEYPELDETSRALFGLTADEAGAVAKPAGWTDIEDTSPARQAMLFEGAGWDVTDDKRRPLRVLGHFNQQLWCAIHGVAGAVPFTPEDDKPQAWISTLEAEAAKFRRR